MEIWVDKCARLGCLRGFQCSHPYYRWEVSLLQVLTIFTCLNVFRQLSNRDSSAFRRPLAHFPRLYILRHSLVIGLSVKYMALLIGCIDWQLFSRCPLVDNRSLEHRIWFDEKSMVTEVELGIIIRQNISFLFMTFFKCLCPQLNNNVLFANGLSWGRVSCNILVWIEHRSLRAERLLV